MQGSNEATIQPPATNYEIIHLVGCLAEIYNVNQPEAATAFGGGLSNATLQTLEKIIAFYVQGPAGKERFNVPELLKKDVTSTFNYFNSLATKINVNKIEYLYLLQRLSFCITVYFTNSEKIELKLPYLNWEYQNITGESVSVNFNKNGINFWDAQFLLKKISSVWYVKIKPLLDKQKNEFEENYLITYSKTNKSPTNLIHNPVQSTASRNFSTTYGTLANSLPSSPHQTTNPEIAIIEEEGVFTPPLPTKRKHRGEEKTTVANRPDKLQKNKLS